MRQEGWTLDIVPLQERHLEALAKMEEEIFSQPWSLRSFEELLTRSYCHYFVAEKEGLPVGIAGMVVLGDEADIDKVMVDPNYRNQGIAADILDTLFSKGEELGVHSYTLEVRKSNASAIHLYEKKGFVSQGIRPRFYEKPVEDAVIMWKRNDEV